MVSGQQSSRSILLIFPPNYDCLWVMIRNEMAEDKHEKGEECLTLDLSTQII